MINNINFTQCNSLFFLLLNINYYLLINIDSVVQYTIFFFLILFLYFPLKLKITIDGVNLH